MQEIPDGVDEDYPPPPEQDQWPVDGVRLHRRAPLWPFVAGGLAATALATAGVLAALGPGAKPRPTEVRAALDAGPSQAALGKLAGAMKDGVVVAQPASPPPPAPDGLEPRDRAVDPGERRPTQPHDASPYDAAPAPLPVDQSLLSPTPTEWAMHGEALRRVHPRAAWNGLATGDPARRAAIDRAGALVEQGELDAARDALSPLVDGGDPLAAFAMAETYDPARLLAWKDAFGKPDIAKARDLYAKAKAGGVSLAVSRIEALR